MSAAPEAPGDQAAPAKPRPKRRPRPARAGPAEPRSGGAPPGPRRGGSAPRAAPDPGPRRGGLAPRAAPDPAHLVRLGGRWRVRLAAFAPAEAAASSPPALRELLAPHAAELAALEAEADVGALPDDLLVTAAATGALTCMPFLDILDGGYFARAPCLCCYAAHAAARAREAGAALQLFQRYYDGASYLGSRAYVRAVAALARDLREDEVAEVAGFLAGLDSTCDAVREVNGRWAGRMCVAVPPCRPGTLWVYSTADGRRLLRHLARGLRKGGPPVKVTVASSDSATFPRYRFRMYAASRPEAAGEPVSLLEAALAWSRARAPPRKNGA